MRFRVEHAEPEQVDALCAIERAAVQLFRGHRAWPSYAAMPIPPALLLRAIGRGLVWVARDVDGELAGFVWLDTDVTSAGIGIAEIDVMPSRGRRGIGAALLEHACDWARAAGYRQVDLGTLADVAWNAPFYAQHGFVAVGNDDPGFAPARQRDHDNGFPADLRVYMRRALAPLPDVAWTVWPAPAKLNLFLHITGQREDGFHELQTVFRLLDWGDEVRLRVRADGKIRRLRGAGGIPEAQDLAVRAAHLLRAHVNVSVGAQIAVHKRIPIGGGLGGGSSDAASVLVGLNALWALGLSVDDLATLGQQLGADVPVFVRGHSAWAEGIGERLAPLQLPRRHYVVLDPRARVSTTELFQAPELTRNAPAATISSFVSGETTGNAFTYLVRARHPAVAAALDWLGKFGQARLTGSGGCVFLETRSYDQAVAVGRRCPPVFTAHVASGVAISPLQETLARHRFLL